jgi:D-alanine-D-alanine ligase
MSRYKIGVIFGSRSTEHEVSIVTAMQVIGFLRERHDVIPIYNQRRSMVDSG